MKGFLTVLILSIPLYIFSQKPQEIPPAGGGEYISEKGECLTPQERADIEAKLVENILLLKSQGNLPENKSAIVSFDWPLQAASGLNYESYYAVNNFVDQNTGAGIQDYDCGSRSYNGHNGTDIDTWPFPWYLVDNDLVEVIAAEAGTIILKQDGEDDDHCSCIGNWNAVFVQHIDGSIAWYGHLKKNSLTTKSVGATVAKGEYLGVVASSGCSTQPHLHFEIYEQLPYNNSNLIDPYSGSCNSLNTQTWWATQKPYREPTLNANLTHDAIPEHGCPGSNEDPHFSNAFFEGVLGRYAVYYHDQTVNHVSTMTLRKPNGIIWQTWNHTSPNTYTKSWWYWNWSMPSDYGTWTFEVSYQGQTGIHEFIVYGPSAPACTNLTSPLSGATGVSVDADLTWATPVTNPATGFKLSVGTTPGGTDILNNEDVGLVNTYDPGTLPYNATIYVTIQPYNPSGEAAGCIEESFDMEDCTQNEIVTWLGVTGDWNDKNNWDTGYVPSSCSFVIIPSGSVNIPAGIIAYTKTLEVQLGAVFDVPISAELIVE